MTNELEHFGVKGMKWGVRKDKARSAVERAKSKVPKLSDNQKKVAKAAVVAGVATASYILGKNAGVKLSDAKSQARIKAGRELITKTLYADASFNRLQLYRLTPSEVSYIDYLMEDTFRNRV